MHPEEQVNQSGVADLVRVERHFHDFGMIGVAMADLAIAGIVGGAAGIAADRVTDAGHLQEEVLHAPEATRAEECLLHDPVSIVLTA